MIELPPKHPVLKIVVGILAIFLSFFVVVVGAALVTEKQMILVFIDALIASTIGVYGSLLIGDRLIARVDNLFKYAKAQVEYDKLSKDQAKAHRPFNFKLFFQTIGLNIVKNIYQLADGIYSLSVIIFVKWPQKVRSIHYKNPFLNFMQFFNRLKK